MRRIGTLALMTVVLTAMLAGAAGAQALRDPFRPLVGATQPAPQPGAAPALAPAPAPTVQPGTPGQPPLTGFDPQPWVLAALTLVSLGGAMVVLARVRSTA